MGKRRKRTALIFGAVFVYLSGAFTPFFGCAKGKKENAPTVEYAVSLAKKEKKTVEKNVVVDGVAIGKMPVEKAVELLRKKREENAPTLEVVAGKKSFVFSGKEIGSKDAYSSLLPKLKAGQTVESGATYFLKDDENALARVVENVGFSALDATVSFGKDGFSYSPERTGVFVDKEKLKRDVEEKLQKAKGGERVKVRLFICPVYPKTTVETLKKSTALLSSFTTYFSTADQNRTKNIALAAKFLDGLCIKENEEFSFNTAVGERTKKRGFADAKVISGGEFVSGAGGGVCQVSTTLYNATLLAGLKITRRRAHSLAVSYVSPSRDAMVSSASDFRFLNDKATPVYLSVKTGDGWICVKVFGKSDGYQYKIVSEQVGEIEPPPPKTVFGDEEKEIKPARFGVKSEAYLEKYFSGALVEKKRISTDSYAAVRGIVQIKR